MWAEEKHKPDVCANIFVMSHPFPLHSSPSHSHSVQHFYSHSYKNPMEPTHTPGENLLLFRATLNRRGQSSRRSYYRRRTSRWISTSGSSGTTSGCASTTARSCVLATRCSDASGGRTRSLPTPSWRASTTPPPRTRSCASSRAVSSCRVSGTRAGQSVWQVPPKKTQTGSLLRLPNRGAK